MNSSFSLQDIIFGAKLQSITEICANIILSAELSHEQTVYCNLIKNPKQRTIQSAIRVSAFLQNCSVRFVPEVFCFHLLKTVRDLQCCMESTVQKVNPG